MILYPFWFVAQILKKHKPTAILTFRSKQQQEPAMMFQVCWDQVDHRCNDDDKVTSSEQMMAATAQNYEIRSVEMCNIEDISAVSLFFIF